MAGIKINIKNNKNAIITNPSITDTIIANLFFFKIPPMNTTIATKNIIAKHDVIPIFKTPFS